MRKVVSLSTYLESYNLTREVFDREIENNRDFYDNYIEWGSKKDGSDTILSPKALDKLGEAFNESDSPKMTITIDGEIKKSVSLEPESTEDKIKRKRRTKAEIESERKVVQMDMSDFMDKPVSEPVQEKTKTVTKKKKSRLNITKQFIQEHGKTDSSDNIYLKQLRKFLLNDGSHKAEEIALMGDEEVKAAFGKDYYVIGAEEGTYFIKRSALIGIMSDVYVVEKE